MRIKAPEAKSSFLSVEKDMGLIANLMLKNERLKRLLYYTSKDALDRPDLTQEQSIELIGKNIKNVPKILVDKEVLNYVMIVFDSFRTNDDNPEFRDSVIEFDIICHLDQWQLPDFQLRPYKIAAEIDSMMDKRHFTGIGVLNFIGASQIVLSEEFAGLCLMYRTVHGEEDKKFQASPEKEQQFLEDWDKFITSVEEDYPNKLWITDQH